MFDFNDFIKLSPKDLCRKEVFISSPLSPIIIEWWNPHPVYRLHKHTGFEEFAVMRHGVCVHYHRRQFQLLAPGDATFIGTQNPHGYVCPHEVGLFNVVFNSDSFYHKFPEVKKLLDELKALSLDNPYLKISPQNLKQTLSIVHRIEYERSQEFDDITSSSMFSLFLQIAVMLLRDNSPKYQLQKNIKIHKDYKLETLITAISYIRKDVSEKIKDITYGLNQQKLNTKTVQRYFQKYTRISIYEFILLQKLVLTMNVILCEPSRSLSDIIEGANYANYRSFARHVEHFFHVSPKIFHQQILTIGNLRV